MIQLALDTSPGALRVVGANKETIEFGMSVDAEKYRLNGETFLDKVERIAAAYATNATHHKALRHHLATQALLPAGRVQSAAGQHRKVTPFNCYVSQTIADDFGSIMDALQKAGTTMRMGGGIGYDFSQLRPAGDEIKSLQSVASGPVSFMQPFDAVCKTISSAGHRRGAQMGVLRVDHPDIFDFIRAKQNSHNLTAFNISVGITDEFMRAVRQDKDFELRFGDEVYRTVRAKELWDEIMMTTWDWAEPGVLFLDHINRDNNLRDVEEIAATNPCAEQPLPPNGACLLSSINMTAIKDHEHLRQVVEVAVEMLDNVIDEAYYPTDEQRAEAIAKRRIGIGVTGMANHLEAIGYRYGSDRYLDAMESRLQQVALTAYRTSIRLAKDRGAAPVLRGVDRLHLSFFERMIRPYLTPAESLDYDRHGLRNSHLLSIAPTGTISLTAANVSSGIEPTFSKVQTRTVRTLDGTKDVTLLDYAYAQGHEVTEAEDVTVLEHLAVLARAQKWVDSAVSKTLNVGDHVTFGEFKDIYMKAWETGCKGCTTFRAAGKRFGILNKAPDEADTEVVAGEACYFDPETGTKTCE